VGNLFKILGLTILILITSVIGVSTIVSWNWLHRPLSKLLSITFEREFNILELDFNFFSGQPIVNINNLYLANSNWGKKPFLLHIEKIIAQLDLWSLLKGHWVLPKVILIKPIIYLELSPQNLPNWIFGKPSEQPLNIKIKQLSVQEGSLTFFAPHLDTDFTAQITEKPIISNHAVALHGIGRIRNGHTELKLRAESLAVFLESWRSLNLDGCFTWGYTSGRIGGMLVDPLKFQGFDFEIEMNGPSPAVLYPLTGINLPYLPLYKIQAHIKQQQNKWMISNIEGLIGGSDFAGDLVWEVSNKQLPRLFGKLKSNQLSLIDIGIGKDTPPQNPPPPAEPLNFDVNLEFYGKKVISPLILEEVKTLIRVKEGQFYLDSLNFGLTGGQVNATIKLDSHFNPMPINLTTQFKLLDLNRLLAPLGIKQQDSGNLSGKLQFVSKGGNIIETFKTAEGNAFFMVTRAQLDSILLALARLDLAKTLNSVLLIDKSVAVRCAVAKVIAHNGVFTFDPIVIDAATTKVTGNGTINLLINQLDFTFEPHPKDLSLFSAYSPFRVTGNLQSPEVRIKVGSLGGRMAAAAALGALIGPVGAVMPFIEPGIGEDNDCQNLVNNASINVTD